ncbi:hypothetical protein TNCV_1420991 [Trichonephila clavipes]|nr:hypothetical protein TNCV_1420991 [Trichonephila clavipes]
MSPIEHAWDLVGRSLGRDPRPAASKDELLLRIKAIWNYFPHAKLQNLLDSMPRCIAALIAASGSGSNSGQVGDVCKCIVLVRHGGILNSRRATSPLWRLGEEKRKALDQPQGVHCKIEIETR